MFYFILCAICTINGNLIKKQGRIPVIHHLGISIYVLIHLIHLIGFLYDDVLLLIYPN